MNSKNKKIHKTVDNLTRSVSKWQSASQRGKLREQVNERGEIMRLDPEVIEDAMQRTGSRSVDELGWKFLNKTGTTVRNYVSGKSMPTIPTLMILKRITNKRLDEMIIETHAEAA